MNIPPSTQYATAANLRARQRLWEAQVPRFEIVPWVLELAGLDTNSTLSVLDVGCGNGMYLREMHGRGIRAVGTDLSAGMLRASDYDELAQGDVQTLPFRTASFDVVIAPHMLYHVPDRVAAAHELRRVLRKGGICVAVTNGKAHMRSLRSIVEDIVRETTPGWEMRDPSTRYFTLDNGADILGAAFSSVEVVRPTTNETVRLTDADIAADYVASTGDFYAPEVTIPWSDLVDEVRTRIAAAVAADGVFEVAGDTGAIVCR